MFLFFCFLNLISKFGFSWFFIMYFCLFFCKALFRSLLFYIFPRCKLSNFKISIYICEYFRVPMLLPTNWLMVTKFKLTYWKSQRTVSSHERIHVQLYIAFDIQRLKWCRMRNSQIGIKRLLGHVFAWRDKMCFLA